jgi:hypothetical protein
MMFARLPRMGKYCPVLHCTVQSYTTASSAALEVVFFFGCLVVRLDMAILLAVRGDQSQRELVAPNKELGEGSLCFFAESWGCQATQRHHAPSN